MGFVGKQKSGPVYSNISLIKKSLVQAPNGKLPYHDIVLFLRKMWIKSSADDIELFVNLALNAKRSYFHQDENGLWEIKNQVNTGLNPIVSHVKKLSQPFKIKEITKLIASNASIKELDNYLKSDIRFTQIEGSSFWLLSEWELINDLVYDYMQENSVETSGIGDIVNDVKLKYNIESDTALFAPQIDERFSVIKNLVFVELEDYINQNKEEVSIPEEVTEEVARASVKLMNWVQTQEGQFEVKNCIPIIFGIKAHEKPFELYLKAIEEFLALIPSMLKVEKGKWISKREVPEFNPDKPNSYYSIHGSIPTIKNVDELVNKAQNEYHEQLNQDKSNVKVKENELISHSYNIISYYERVKGYLNLPPNLSNLLNTREKTGKIKIQVEGFIYECWWIEKNKSFYFYGDGIHDFYGDYLIEPGHKLKIEFIDDSLFKVNIIGFDERYNVEQSRYLDIGKIAEESKTVNKSVFTIMCEVLATYPSGLHWTQLLDKINKIRTTTQNTVYNLLSQNDCFESITSKSGYWRLNITKLSRFYIDEEGNEVEQKTKKIEIEEDSNNLPKGVQTSNKNVDLDNVNIASFADEEEYELPPLQITFKKWAEKQTRIRFSEARKLTSNQDELIENVTKAYSRLLCNFANSRQTYSMEYMDLVQEGFFGLLKAIKNYDKKYSFAHYIRMWLTQRLGRYRSDTSNLIRLPVHMVNEIDKLDKLLDEYLLLFGRYPTKEEITDSEISLSAVDSIPMYTIDYVSFEQYWGYISNQRESLFYNPWYAGELINNKISGIYYKKSEYQLYEALSKLCDIQEQDSEKFWLDINVEEQIDKIFLSKDLEELLEQLSAREENIIRLRFGLDDDKARTLEEVGVVFGVTRERIRQVEKKALKNLLSLAIKRDMYEYI